MCVCVLIGESKRRKLCNKELQYFVLYYEQVDEMDDACGTCWNEQKYIHQIWYGERNEREDLHVDINILLNVL